MFEILNTERSYVRDLNIICDIFIKGIKDNALLTREEIISIFNNVHTLQEEHTYLLHVNIYTTHTHTHTRPWKNYRGMGMG